MSSFEDVTKSWMLSIINECLKGTNRINDSVGRTAAFGDAYDRETADKNLASVLVGDTFNSKINMSRLCAYVGQQQEAQRYRRDMRITSQKHKRLMLGCLSTLISEYNDWNKS